MKESRATAIVGLVRLTIPLPDNDYRVYLEAWRLLKRIMGRKAPDLETLILRDLQGRDAQGIADDYLDAIDWPSSRGRVISLTIRRDRFPVVRRSPRRRPGIPVDPSRN